MYYEPATETSGLIHIRDDLINEEGRVDIGRIQPLARLGHLDRAAREKG